MLLLLTIFFIFGVLIVTLPILLQMLLLIIAESKTIARGVKIFGDAVKFVRLTLTWHNIYSNLFSRACLLLLTYMLTYLLDLKDMVSFIFLICFIWGIYQSFINYKNLDDFITRFIANRLNNIIDILIFNTLIFIIMFIVYYFWEISSFNFLAFWLYMNMPSGEMPSGEGSGTSSGGGDMLPGNNQGGPLPPVHDSGYNQNGNNADYNNQNNQQINTNIDPYVRGQDLFVLDTLHNYMCSYANENPQGGPHGESIQN